MADDKEIEIEVTEEDPKTHVKTKKKITIKKKAGKAEADLGSKTLTGLKKSKPPVPPKKEPTKVSGRYHPNWGADDRDVTIVIDCDANPPTVEVVVTYAEGTDKGKRDEENCHKYEIDPRECKKAKDFVEGLDVPYLVALGPAVGDRYMADWIGPALEALAVVLIEVGEALRS